MICIHDDLDALYEEVTGAGDCLPNADFCLWGEINPTPWGDWGKTPRNLGKFVWDNFTLPATLDSAPWDHKGTHKCDCGGPAEKLPFHFDECAWWGNNDGTQ